MAVKMPIKKIKKVRREVERMAVSFRPRASA